MSVFHGIDLRLLLMGDGVKHSGRSIPSDVWHECLIAFVNVFTIKPGQQQVVVNRIRQVCAEVVKVQPGFIDAQLPKSDDGTMATAIAHC